MITFQVGCFRTSTALFFEFLRLVATVVHQTNPYSLFRNHSSVCFTMPTRDGATLIPTGSVSSMTGSTGAPEAAGVGGGVIAAPSSHDLYRLLNNRFRLSMKQQQKAVYWSCGIQLVRWCTAVCCCCWGEGAPRGNKTVLCCIAQCVVPGAVVYRPHCRCCGWRKRRRHCSEHYDYSCDLHPCHRWPLRVKAKAAGAC